MPHQTHSTHSEIIRCVSVCVCPHFCFITSSDRNSCALTNATQRNYLIMFSANRILSLQLRMHSVLWCALIIICIDWCIYERSSVKHSIKYMSTHDRVVCIIRRISCNNNNTHNLVSICANECSRSIKAQPHTCRTVMDSICTSEHRHMYLIAYSISLWCGKVKCFVVREVSSTQHTIHNFSQSNS